MMQSPPAQGANLPVASLRFAEHHVPQEVEMVDQGRLEVMFVCLSLACDVTLLLLSCCNAL